MTAIDPQALTAILARLHADTAPAYLEQSLQQIVSAVAGVFGVSGSGLMFVDEGSVLRYVAASDEPGRVLESAQEDLGYGPCVDALIHDQHVMSSDLSVEQRWSGLPDKVVPYGVIAVLGVPVHLGGGAVGSLDVYYDRAHPWSDEEVAALSTFSSLIEALIGAALLAHRQGELAEQLQYALDHRVVIERAVGVLMGRGNLDAVDAFNQLRSMARSRREKVGAIAQEILDEVRAAPDEGGIDSQPAST